MQTQCEIMVRHFLPTLRSLIAKELINNHGYSQIEVAKTLNVTQAAVSQYLSAKRGKHSIEQFHTINRVDEIVRNITRDIVKNNYSPKDTHNITCEICKSLMIEKKLI